MTYLDVERYVVFYREEDSFKTDQLLRAFCVFNAESTAVGYAATQSKNGASSLAKYSRDMVKRFSNEQEEVDNSEYFDKQFEGLNFG